MGRATPVLGDVRRGSAVMCGETHIQNAASRVGSPPPNQQRATCVREHFGSTVRSPANAARPTYSQLLCPKPVEIRFLYTVTWAVEAKSPTCGLRLALDFSL